MFDISMHKYTVYFGEKLNMFNNLNKVTLRQTSLYNQSIHKSKNCSLCKRQGESAIKTFPICNETEIFALM